MKSLFSFIFLFLFANSAFAADLCDTSCNLTITFPTGGSITAVEPLTLTFGDGGLVDTVATTTAYVAGNTLPLGTGEVLSFEAGGSLDLGAGGNIDYTNIAIATTGVITIEVIDGSETITILDMSITDGALILNSEVIIEGSLILSGDLIIDGTGSITNTGTLSIDSGTTTLELSVDSSSGTIASDSGSLAVTAAGSLILADGTIISDVSLSIIELNSFTTTLSIGTIVPLSEITIDGVLYQIEYITVDGETVMIATAPDGTTGIIEFIDGEPVFIPDEEAGNGASGWLLILGLPLLMSALRRRQVTGSFAL